MNKGILVLLAAAVLALPNVGLAAAHNMDHGSMDHGSMSHGATEHGNMDHQMDDSMLMLPAQTVDGIKALVHIKDVKAAMAKMKMSQTHHFMVMLSDAKSGKQVVPQLVAVKITAPDGKEGAPVELMAMGEHAGADVTLATAGEYKFKVAIKLADGKKVQFDFSTKIK